MAELVEGDANSERPPVGQPLHITALQQKKHTHRHTDIPGDIAHAGRHTVGGTAGRLHQGSVGKHAGGICSMVPVCLEVWRTL